MKGALFAAFGTVLVAAAIVGASLSLRDETDALSDAELAWVRDYYAAASCGDIPSAPSEKLRRIARLARATCFNEGDDARVHRLIAARLVVNRPLPTTTAVADDSHVDPRLGRVASSIARRRVQARCWSDEDWRRVNKEVTAIWPSEDDYWAIGRADPNGRIHLLGALCRPVARFFGSRYTPASNIDRAELAEALLVLAHEAEHERDFSKSEAEVECRAIQRVRGLARTGGRDDAFAADVAAYAWTLSYPRGDPEYATRHCRNRGALDLRPRDDAWP